MSMELPHKRDDVDLTAERRKSALLPTIGFSVMASAMLFSATKPLEEGRMDAGRKQAETSVSDSELDKLLDAEFRRQLDEEFAKSFGKRLQQKAAAGHKIDTSTSTYHSKIATPR
jgi:hypothetical protein